MREDELYPVARDRTVTLLAGTREGLAFAWHDRQVRAVLLVVTASGSSASTSTPSCRSSLRTPCTSTPGRSGCSRRLRLRSVRGSDRHGVVQAGDVPARSWQARSASASCCSPSPRSTRRVWRAHPLRRRRVLHPLRRERQRARPARRPRSSSGAARRALPVRVRRPRAARLSPLGHARRASAARRSPSSSRVGRPGRDGVRGIRLADRPRPPSNEGGPPAANPPISEVTACH